jgi:hypothetical protein
MYWDLTTFKWVRRSESKIALCWHTFRLEKIYT